MNGHCPYWPCFYVTYYLIKIRQHISLCEYCEDEVFKSRKLTIGLEHIAGNHVLTRKLQFVLNGFNAEQNETKDGVRAESNTMNAIERAKVVHNTDLNGS